MTAQTGTDSVGGGGNGQVDQEMTFEVVTRDGERRSPAQVDAAPQPTTTRKKRRSRKGLEKRFECTFEGCGKSYSRAEHLNRHQLNHKSSQVYRCEYEDCPRSFVRADLLKRHMDRHFAKAENQRQRSDSFHDSKGTEIRLDQSNSQHSFNDTPMTDTSSATFGSAHMAEKPRHHTDTQSLNESPETYSHAFLSPPDHGFMMGHQHAMAYNSAAPPMFLPPGPYPDSNFFAQNGDPIPQEIHGPYMSGTDLTDIQTSDGSSLGHGRRSSHSQASQLMILEQMSMSGAGPVFGGNGGLHKSPNVGMPEDFMAYLFNSGPGQIPSAATGLPSPSVNYGDLQHSQYAPQTFEMGSVSSQFSTPQHNIMSLHNIMDSSTPEATISDDRSQDVFDFIKDRFHGNEHPSLKELRESLISGDRSKDDHLLSRQMMQAYIWCYWSYFSDQIPILHTPSFIPETCPTPLLLIVIAIGATCLNKTQSSDLSRDSTKVSNFIASHLRWEIFMDPAFRPPAKLWVFQTLVLLELYEKMCSTRELHERAHIHHATTITLMRRGRSLIGKSSSETPVQLYSSDRRRSSTEPIGTSHEDLWNEWIINESTRRTACAAFVIDSIHASMFGHSGVMVAHEMRLPLPCDESMWKAKNSAELGRAESSLNARGIKPISFLEGLKHMLNGQEITTTPFGRTMLMAGLLGVSYHMQQRDLQVSVLGSGVSQLQAGRDRWRSAVTRAYDFWKTSYDKALEQNGALSDPYRNDSGRTQLNVIFESRTVLHNLAHMTMHADILDCQIFARAKRLLGRSVGAQEFENAKKRITESWAPSARGRDAAFYALQFLKSVLAPDMNQYQDKASLMHGELYEAKRDILLNRPWVMYYAALVIWCYGYATEGSYTHNAAAESPHHKWIQMRDYLGTFSRLQSPDDLSTMKGVNRNTALLLMLKETFEDSRWELLHEAATLLQNCIDLNSGSTGL